MTAVDSVSYMDRRVTLGTPGVSVAYSGGVTTWTLPYSVATDGSEGDLRVARIDSPALLTSTRPAANQIAVVGDYHLRPVYIGVLFPFLYVPSEVVRRDPQGNAYVGGRVQLIRLSAVYTETTNLLVTVKRSLRGATSAALATPRVTKGKLLSLIQAWASEARTEISDLSPGAVALSSLVWEGKHYTEVERT